MPPFIFLMNMNIIDKIQYLFIVFFIVNSLFAEISTVKKLSNDIYEITEIVKVINITPEKAKEIAIQKACYEAIEQYCGIEISGRVSSIQAGNRENIHIDHFSKMINQSTQGIILSKEIIEDKTIIENHIIKKIVTLRIKVGKQIGSKDNSFNINAELNNQYFKEGDLLELWVSSSIDCYITILNITSNGKVITIFPNEYHTENYLITNEKLFFPNDEDKLIGLELKVNLLSDHDEDTEIIKIIATKNPISININSDYQKAIDSLYNFLVKIPRNEIEELDLEYYIYK